VGLSPLFETLMNFSPTRTEQIISIWAQNSTRRPAGQ
jgi:hypothetical protein